MSLSNIEIKNTVSSVLHPLLYAINKLTGIPIAFDPNLDYQTTNESWRVATQDRYKEQIVSNDIISPNTVDSDCGLDAVPNLTLGGNSSTIIGWDREVLTKSEEQGRFGSLNLVNIEGRDWKMLRSELKLHFRAFSSSTEEIEKLEMILLSDLLISNIKTIEIDSPFFCPSNPELCDEVLDYNLEWEDPTSIIFNKDENHYSSLDFSLSIKGSWWIPTGVRYDEVRITEINVSSNSIQSNSTSGVIGTPKDGDSNEIETKTYNEWISTDEHWFSQNPKLKVVASSSNNQSNYRRVQETQLPPKEIKGIPSAKLTVNDYKPPTKITEEGEEVPTLNTIKDNDKGVSQDPSEVGKITNISGEHGMWTVRRDLENCSPYHVYDAANLHNTLSERDIKFTTGN